MSINNCPLADLSFPTSPSVDIEETKDSKGGPVRLMKGSKQGVEGV